MLCFRPLKMVNILSVNLCFVSGLIGQQSLCLSIGGRYNAYIHYLPLHNQYLQYPISTEFRGTLVHETSGGLKERTSQQVPHLPLKVEHAWNTEGRQRSSKKHERPKNLIMSFLTHVISEPDVIRRKVSLSGNPGDVGRDGGGRKRVMISSQIEEISAF